jgi:hypothetical protein
MGSFFGAGMLMLLKLDTERPVLGDGGRRVEPTTVQGRA